MIKNSKQNSSPVLCRDCGAIAAQAAIECAACASHNLLAHDELADLSIAHVDCDAFFASVEKRDNPELAGRPVIVGGGKRGVVAAACYIARAYGVHSAMPMFKALKLCPHAAVVGSGFDKYAQEGARVKALMLELTPLVQSVSIDEAFMDLSGTQRLHDGPPAQALIRLQNRIKRAIGVTVSVGLSYNKFLAKTASDLDKPNGFSIIGRAEALDFLADKPVDFIFGVGPAFARTLRRAGIVTIQDIRKHSDSDMARKFGDAGLRLARLARAEDFRPVKTESVRKSISSEITFQSDIKDESALEKKLWNVCMKTSRRAKAKALAGRVVTLKLKSAGFETITRRRTLAEPVQLADSLFAHLLPLLSAELKARNGRRKYRLIGAGISDLCPHTGDSGDLLDPKAAKRGAAERASDIARAKFGNAAIVTGRSFRPKAKPDQSPE